jgi:hypothetical protein
MHDIPELDKKGLREFGLVTGAIIAVLFGLFFPWLLGFQWPLWPWILAGILAAWALIAPLSLNPVYHGWMRFGLVLGWFSSRIVLSILFYLIFTPVGLFMRTLRGYDPLKRKPDQQADSYRIMSSSRPKKHMERPF